jgi:hypothetical protein
MGAVRRKQNNLSVMQAPPTEYPRRSAPEYLIHCLENGLPIEGYCSPQVSRDAQEILEAGLRAANTGQTQPIPLQPGEILL